MRCGHVRWLCYGSLIAGGSWTVGAQDVARDTSNARISFRGSASFSVEVENEGVVVEADAGEAIPVVPVASMTVPLHSHSGTHHLFVFLGSPEPQRQTLILDTGSRYTAFPCQPWCNQCGDHHSPKFDGRKSTTLTQNQFGNCTFASNTDVDNDYGDNQKKNRKKRKDDSCTFHQKYLEGSGWTAKEFEDFLWLGTWDAQESTEEYMPHLAIPFTFGCQVSVTGHFARQYANGILGMARALDENAFLNTMVQSNAIDRAAFATCLTRKGGTLSLGGSGLARINNRNNNNSNNNHQQQYHMEPMQFTNLLMQDHGLYSLKVMKVFVGDVCITCHEDAANDKDRNLRQVTLMAFQAGKGVLLDSGTTDTFFPKIAHLQFEQAFEAATGLKMQEKRVYTYEQFTKLPEIRMVFAPNTTMVIPPSNYMDHVPRNPNATSPQDEVKPWMGSRKLVMRVYCEEPKGAVLGANAMYHYDVLYDLQDKRVGLARSFCGAE